MANDLKHIKINKAFWNGLFISLMVVLVWWGYNFIRGPKIEDGYSFQVKFDDILSLTKGNDVIYSGLIIGEVREVGKIGGANSAEITPIVTLSIKEEYEDILYKDAIFTIKSPLFVGDYWVEVTRGIPRSQDKIVRGEVLKGVSEKTKDVVAFDPPRVYIVPENIIGSSLEYALLKLKKNGFSIGKIDTVYNKDFVNEIVFDIYYNNLDNQKVEIYEGGIYTVPIRVNIVINNYEEYNND